MTETERQRQLAHIDAAIAEADRVRSPEELARAAHELAQEIEPAAIAQGQLLLRASD